MTDAPDTEHTPRDFGDTEDNEYVAARDERERKQRERQDAAHEKAKAEKEGEDE